MESQRIFATIHLFAWNVQFTDLVWYLRFFNWVGGRKPFTIFFSLSRGLLLFLFHSHHKCWPAFHSQSVEALWKYGELLSRFWIQIQANKDFFYFGRCWTHSYCFNPIVFSVTLAARIFRKQIIKMDVNISISKRFNRLHTKLKTVNYFRLWIFGICFGRWTEYILLSSPLTAHALAFPFQSNNCDLFHKMSPS